MNHDKDEKKMPGTFCVLPWIHRFTNIGGEIQVCCTSEEKDNNVRAGAENMKAPKDFDNEAIMNSEYMMNLRRQMLEGQWPELCHRCQVTEASGGISRRQVENRAYKEDVPELLTATRPDGYINDLKVRSFDMRLGNICNLACRMCNPRSSSGWNRDWTKVDQDHFHPGPDLLAEYRQYDWYKSPAVLEEFRKQLPHLRHIHFAGGEPMIAPEMIKFLRAAVESGFAENMEVSYNTNLTLIPDEAKRLWPHFRAVKILASIDAFGPVNELIRHPSRWSVIDRNLRDLDKNYWDYGLTEVLVMSTVQVYNIFRLQELYDYLALNFENIVKLPHLIDLHYPDYYRTQIMPAEMKAEAETRLSRILQASEDRIAQGIIPKYQSHLLGSVKSSINFMKMENLERLIPEFHRSAESKDGFRKQDVYTVIPELQALREKAVAAGRGAPQEEGRELFGEDSPEVTPEVTDV